MDFKTYFLGLSGDDRKLLALACNTSVGHLNNCVYACTTISPALSVLIEKGSKGKVSRIEAYRYPEKVWPELVAAKQKRDAVKAAKATA
jgi:hypothetical protein